MNRFLKIFCSSVLMLGFVNLSHAGAGVTAVYKTSADELWKTVDFHQPSENIMPPIETSVRAGEGLGATKVNSLKGGGEVNLQLV